MVSRLDRLFILLDTGSNESIRLAAAKQLGEVQRVQPNDLDYILQKIREYSSKAVWETRVAAGNATRCVLEHVSPWPSSSDELEHVDDKIRCKQELVERLIRQHSSIQETFKQFDLDKIISLYPKLLSLDTIDSVETTDVISASTSRGSSRGRGSRKESSSRGSKRKNDDEQLMRQRKLINKELGIGMVDSLNIGVKSTDIVTNDDLQAEYDTGETSSTPTKPKTHHENFRTLTSQIAPSYDKLVSTLVKEGFCYDIETFTGEQKSDEKSPQLGDRWPLTNITRQYTEDLFNPSWEIRHGTAIALREIVKLQGRFAGKRLWFSDSSNDLLNQVWLVDMALRAISVLALDRFGDFLFDQVVAPVRENAAQLLGCCVSNMSEENARSTILLLLRMLDSPQWETRHGGVLGLKYSLNVVNETFAKEMLKDSFEAIFKCLADSVDDVSAEAAASLVPVKDLMIETIPDKTPKLIKFLWDHLADLDELTTSTSNIVLLLASLITSSSTQLDTDELSSSIPKLWCLLNHSSTSVRISSLKAFITLLKSQDRTCLSWMSESLIMTALRLIYQRSILENMEEVRPYIEEVWVLLIRVGSGDSDRINLLKATSQFLNYWLCLLMQPTNIAIDRGSTMWLNIASDGSVGSKPEGDIYIGSCTFNAETLIQQKLQITQCRLLGTKLLGSLYANLINDFTDSTEAQHAKETLKYLGDMFTHYIKTKSANQRMFSGWTLESWAHQQNHLLFNNYDKLKTILPGCLKEELNIAIKETSLCFDELAATVTRLQQEARDLVASLKLANITLNLPSPPNDKPVIYSLSQIQYLCDIELVNEVVNKKAQSNSKTSTANSIASKCDDYVSLTNKQMNLRKSLKSTNLSQKGLSTSVLSSLACAQISWRLLPDKLNLVIEPLLESIESEDEQSLQDKSIRYLITLIDITHHELGTNKNILNEILQRLCKGINCHLSINESDEQTSSVTKENGIEGPKIILLDNLQRKAEMGRSLSRRHSSITSTGLKRNHSEVENDQAINHEQQLVSAINSSKVKIRGTSNALKDITTHFGADLPVRMSQFWELITERIKIQVNKLQEPIESEKKSLSEDQLITSLRVLEVVGDSLHVELRKHLLELLEYLVKLLTSSNAFIRHHSSQCIGVICKMMLSDTLDVLNREIIPMLEDSNVLARCGSIEAIASIIDHLQLSLVPQINIFILHVLRRMSDQNDQVRLMATHCFGKLLSLMPLNLEEKNGKIEAKVESEDLCNGEKTEHMFIQQLLDPKKLVNYTIPFEMKANLRSYQQDGLNWLAFLNRYNLHGILCDEMGLGKTLMTISMIASDHSTILTEQSKKTDQCPSLIICPSTLTEHWLYEIEKFLPSQIRSVLNPTTYRGNMLDRNNLKQRISEATKESENVKTVQWNNKRSIHLIVVSYDMIRSDIDFFKSINWNYCVLDEGHIIKNGKTKLSRAVRLITAKHRLILSGTPIQNNVTELWSLFDFLMPGFLGSERQFSSRYARPILQSREPKSSSRDLEAGALAMESLHRQVLPFILRRLKEDVLDDLPPKILQDYYCELSPLQNRLYEDFTKSKLCNDVTKKSLQNLDEGAAELNTDVKSNLKSHVFQALQYLKNVCNHPKLVLTQKHSQYQEIKKYLDNEKSSLDDISHSSKLTALKQLLLDCGIGVVIQTGDEQLQQQDLALQTVVNQHRALIFCQIRSMVDIIENDLFKKHLPNITYLKLDGSIPTSQRHSIVSKFNNDPSIDVLLLTTQIGGLGLNLTGADTVIFVEHDWNPTKDLQAMDRAHRIGQKKVVNVYRLITKGTLEEKIMGLQKFKTMVSNTVINQDNAGLGTMNVDQLFELFEDTTAGDKATRRTTNSDSCGSNTTNRSNKSSFLDMLPELWDQQQYETEYDLSSFVSSLKN